MEKTILMTGASRGIGRHAAVRMLIDDPDLHLIVTDRSRDSTRLVELLKEESGSHHVFAVFADLASVSSIREATARVLDRVSAGEVPPLTGFVGNAGLQVTSGAQRSADGIEVTFAVNVLANHLFITSLAQHLTRIVVTASDTHFGDFRHNLGFVPAPVWRDPHLLALPNGPNTATAGRTAYSTSKLAVIYLIHEGSRRLPDAVVYSWNPGFVPGTDLFRSGNTFERFLTGPLGRLLTLTPLSVNAKTAGGHLAGLASGAVREPTGSYVNLGTAERSSPASYDETRENRPWAALEEIVGTR